MNLILQELILNDSYLSDTNLRVCKNQLMLESAGLPYGVPDSSVLDPSLVSQYIFPLGEIVRHLRNFSSLLC